VILTFHPIIFSGLKSITGKNYVEKAVLKAIENKIAIIALHTALDNHYFGVNHRICRELGLDQLKILIPKKENLLQLITYVPVDYAEQVKKALFEAGAGNIGFYDECSFSIGGEGTFRPIDGANPFLGKKGTTEKVNEIQLSVIFEKFKKNGATNTALCEQVTCVPTQDIEKTDDWISRLTMNRIKTCLKNVFDIN